MATGAHDVHIERKIARGAAVNLAGSIAKAVSQPLLYIVLTRYLFGPTEMGLYLLAFSFIEIAGALTTSGFVDGGLLYASRHIHSEEDREILYDYMRVVLLLSVAIGIVLAGTISLLAVPFVHFYYPDHPRLAPVLAVLGWSMPLEAFTLTALSIPKSKMIMGYEAVVIGIVKPVAVAVFAAIYAAMDLGAVGISLAFVSAFGITALVSAGLLLRHLDASELLRRPRRIPWEILHFVLPQNLNMALSRLISSLDVIMLGWFGLDPFRIAFYSLGAQIVRNARQAKLAFSGSYSPVLARYSHEGRIQELNALFRKVTGWTSAVGMAALFVVAYFRDDLLHLFSSQLSGDTTFMLILLVNPFLSVTFGLAGNAVVMAGHSRWNLINSLTVGGLNFLLNLVLIPRYGMIGAASATALAGGVVSVMQIVEARVLVGIQPPLDVVARWVGVAAVVLGPVMAFAPSSPWSRLATGLAALSVYGAVWLALERGRLTARKGGTP